MGSVYRGIHEPLALKFRDMFELTTLIETGTYHAETARWAKQHFKHVITIEASQELYEAYGKPLVGDDVIVPIFGVSPLALEGAIRRTEEPILFWLDAHWCGNETYLSNPILEEVDTIDRFAKKRMVVMIDDARLFSPELTEGIYARLVTAGLRPYTQDDVIVGEPILPLPKEVKGS